MVSTGKSGLEAAVAGAPTSHSFHVPKLPHISGKGLLYATAGTLAILTAVYLARGDSLPLPTAPPGRDDGRRQEQPYKQNGLPAIALATPEPTATPTPQPYNTPTATATPERRPTPYVPPTAIPPTVTPIVPTPPPTQQPPPVTPVQPTATATPTATPSPTLEERAQSIVDKYRNDTTTTITNYSQIQPIVDSVLKDTGLKTDNIQIKILSPEKFNDLLCRIDKVRPYSECMERQKSLLAVPAFAADGKFVYVREANFFSTLSSTLREVLLAIGDVNYNAKTNLSAEITGNLGSSFANHTLAEKFSYAPFYNIADTPDNRELARARFVGEGEPGWIRSVWLIQEASGFIDRSKPAVAPTAYQALKAYKFFVNLSDPDKYATDLAKTHTLTEDNKWVTQVLQLRLKKDKAPSTMDAVVLKEQLFYIP